MDQYLPFFLDDNTGFKRPIFGRWINSLTNAIVKNNECLDLAFSIHDETYDNIEQKTAPSKDLTLPNLLF